MTRSGTNCCFKLLHAGKLHMSELCELLKTMYPQFAAGIPTEVAPGASLDLDSWGFDNSKMVRTYRVRPAHAHCSAVVRFRATMRRKEGDSHFHSDLVDLTRMGLFWDGRLGCLAASCQQRRLCAALLTP